MENKNLDINLNSIIKSVSIPDVSIFEFAINLIIALFLPIQLNFFMKILLNLFRIEKYSQIHYIALTTTVIITIVKSSLALSLGLVGALSIVDLELQ